MTPLPLYTALRLTIPELVAERDSELGCADH